MAEEIFDVVDAEDRVVGQAARSEVHARKLLHRAVHIFALDGGGRLLLQYRSPTKDEFPSCYTSSASGHLGVGEDYHTAAVRELDEELGLTTPLEFLVKLPARPETAYEHSALFLTTVEQPVRPDPAEISEVEYFELDCIAEMLRNTPERFASPFRVLFEWYLDREDRALFSLP